MRLDSVCASEGLADDVCKWSVDAKSVFGGRLKVACTEIDSKLFSVFTGDTTLTNQVDFVRHNLRRSIRDLSNLSHPIFYGIQV